MKVRLVATLAWRNLWRNYRRTSIMLAAIIVGVWAMIFMTALMRGMVDQMVYNGLETFVGHMQIHQKNYREDPSIVNSMSMPDENLRRVLNEAEAWTMRVRVPAVINSERESRGISLMGINPHTEAQTSFVASGIIEGRFLETENDSGIIIGKKLAQKLDTDLGKRVVIMSQDPDNNIVDKGARIVGIYKASLSATEEQFVFMSLQSAQEFLGMGSRISEIEILAKDFRDLTAIKNSIASEVDSANELLTWQELQTYLASMLEVMDGFVFVWMVIVFVALSFGLVNTLIMAVFERTREIGLMLALGMKPGFILWQILFESVFLLLLGLIAGTALAWFGIQPLESGIDVSVVAEGMAMMGVGATLYPSLNVSDMVMANIIVIVLGILASLLPAFKASRLNPVAAMTVN